jgi:hypothetical protein
MADPTEAEMTRWIQKQGPTAPSVEEQLHQAIHHATDQLVQINWKMDRLIAAVEKLAEKG